jgi:hypothetical protein
VTKHIEPAPASASMVEFAAFCNELADAVRPIALRYFRSRVSFEQKADRTPVMKLLVPSIGSRCQV